MSARLDCAAVAVTPEELGHRSDLVVSLGGDGTMLRAMRLTDRQRAPVRPENSQGCSRRRDGLIVVVMLGVAVADGTGLLPALMRAALTRVPAKLVTCARRRHSRPGRRSMGALPQWRTARPDAL